MASKRRLKRNSKRGGINLIINRAKACIGKIKYSDFDAAIEAKNTLRRDPVFKGGELNVYCCPINKLHYHVGHRPRRKLLVNVNQES